MTFTASDVLLKAASRIEEEGMWCQRYWFDLTKQSIRMPEQPGINDVFAFGNAVRLAGVRVPECAEGAMVSVAFELVTDIQEAEELFHEASDLLFRVLGDGTPGFNDAPGRTAHEVAEAMRKAAL